MRRGEGGGDGPAGPRALTFHWVAYVVTESEMVGDDLGGGLEARHLVVARRGAIWLRVHALHLHPFEEGVKWLP